MEPRDRICLALDFGGWAAAEPLARRLAPHVGMLKVGLELFAAEGPPAVRAAAALGRPVFLDLKLHDIPATVEGAARAAARSGAALLTVHAAGGEEMVRAAVRGAGPAVRVLAVTVLTSLDRGDLDDLGFACDLDALVLSRARRALEAGCDGVVSSGLEVARLRQEIDGRLVVVTPGIRPVDNREVDDQKRVVTPTAALQQGADYLVVGRPIRDAADPAAAAAAIQAEIRQAVTAPSAS